MNPRILSNQSLFWLRLCLGCVFVLLTVWVAGWGYPTANEQTFRILNRLGSHAHWFWQNVTILGEGLVAFVLLACFSKHNGRFIWTLLLAALIAGISSQALKHILDMPRPAAVLDPETFNLIGAELRSRSFPSGHATTALVAASLATMRFPRFNYLFYALFACVALSRIVVGAHWPFDVLAGGCLGYLCGQFSSWVSAKYIQFGSRWLAGLAWLLQLGLAIWLFVFPLDYPAARLLVVSIASAGVVTSIIRLRGIAAK